jgi:hypothetical protein
MEPLKIGTNVEYHGSLTTHHGPATVAAVHDFDHPTVKSDDGHRYTLATPGTPLYNVRRQSFSVVEDES